MREVAWRLVRAAATPANIHSTSAARTIQTARIAKGWRLKEVQDALIICTHAQTEEAILAPKTISKDDLQKCHDLGAALSAGLSMGVF